MSGDEPGTSVPDAGEARSWTTEEDRPPHPPRKLISLSSPAPRTRSSRNTSGHVTFPPPHPGGHSALPGCPPTSCRRTWDVTRDAQLLDDRQLVGWREWVRVVDNPMPPIKAKVDTGARTSALHAVAIRPDGPGWLRFVVHPHQRRLDDPVELRAPLVDHREVRSSTGVAEPRPTVRLQLSMGQTVWPVEVTLTRRDRMGFRMLLGRTALRGRFVVDPSASFLQGRPVNSAPFEPDPNPGEHDS